MSYFVPKEIPNCCGRCPCFHAEKLMYCQAVKADKNKRIYAPYEGNRPNWCPLTEIPTPHGRLGDLDELEKQFKKAIGTYLPKDQTRHMNIVDAGECRGWTQALMAVQDAKTVIKAEGEDNA